MRFTCNQFVYAKMVDAFFGVNFFLEICWTAYLFDFWLKTSTCSTERHPSLILLYGFNFEIFEGFVQYEPAIISAIIGAKPHKN